MTTSIPPTNTDILEHVPSREDGLKKAALFLASLGPQMAKELLERLDPETAAQIRRKLLSIPTVSSETQQHVFYDFIERGLPRPAQKLGNSPRATPNQSPPNQSPPTHFFETEGVVVGKPADAATFPSAIQPPADATSFAGPVNLPNAAHSTNPASQSNTAHSTNSASQSNTTHSTNPASQSNTAHSTNSASQPNESLSNPPSDLSRNLSNDLSRDPLNHSPHDSRHHSLVTTRFTSKIPFVIPLQGSTSTQNDQEVQKRFEFLAHWPAQTVAAFFQSERPALTARILSLLAPLAAQKILRQFSAAQQGEIKRHLNRLQDGPLQTDWKIWGEPVLEELQQKMSEQPLT